MPALFIPGHKTMIATLKKAIRLILITASVAGVTGFFNGKFYLANAGVDWWLPEDLSDKSAFIVVGSIHNFSYLGGFLGLLISIVYIIRLILHLKAKQNNSKAK
ncbi:hypothetical protein [Lacibacter sp.]|uniref:hypothetical protein n=1 Tax=Lacibacter sp. TaxID=1915409 RepID=UPI002B4B1967|nr:hypothetical protein [Lacibacter sp.]HLP38579.1 hypothetical protein [Lacibacter sp.]